MASSKNITKRTALTMLGWKAVILKSTSSANLVEWIVMRFVVLWKTLRANW